MIRAVDRISIQQGLLRAAIVLAIAVGTLVALAPAASATTLQATVLPPHDGTVTSSPDEPHHTAYGGDYAFDVAGTGTAYARFRNPNGALTLSVAGVGRACASGNFADGGDRIILNVYINGSKVGTVTYAHLTNFPVTSGPIAVGARLGDPVTSANGVSPSTCWTGPHVHVEPRNDVKYGCYFAGLLNHHADSSTPLGLIGGERASTINVPCPAGAEGTWPPANGAYISNTATGEVYVIAGGAPIYVSNWDHVGGSRPVLSVSPEQFATLRQVPSNGTFIMGYGSGTVYRVAGGAPLAVSSWDHLGGPQPYVAVDQTAIDNAGLAGAWSHLNRYPTDMFLHALPSGRMFRTVFGGHAYYVSSWSPYGGVQPYLDVDDWAIDNCDHVNCSPFGNMDNVAPIPGGVIASGWAQDPNSTSPVWVEIVADGHSNTATRAARSRPDVDAVLHRGALYGYRVFAQLTSGSHQVCSYAANVGPGSNQLVGCGTVTVPAPPQPFSDVSPTSTFASDIAWAQAAQVVEGDDSGQFRPSDVITRQASAALIYRFANPALDPADAASCAQSPFSDVSTSNVFCQAIAWASSAGVVSGFTDGTFHPRLAVSRQALAGMMYSLLNGAAAPTPCASRPFSDVSTTSQFCGAIAWLASNDIIQGYGDGRFHPKSPVTRQSMAAYVHRAAGRY